MHPDGPLPSSPFAQIAEIIEAEHGRLAAKVDALVATCERFEREADGRDLDFVRQQELEQAVRYGLADLRRALVEHFRNEESFMALLEGRPGNRALCDAHRQDHARIARLAAGSGDLPVDQRPNDLARALSQVVRQWQGDHVTTHDAALLAMLADPGP